MINYDSLPIYIYIESVYMQKKKTINELIE